MSGLIGSRGSKLQSAHVMRRMRRPADRKKTARLYPSKASCVMRKPWHLSTSVLLMLSAATLASCASAPPIPVVAQCPKMADPPPTLMQPAQAANSLIELAEILQRWLAGANQTLLP